MSGNVFFVVVFAAGAAQAIWSATTSEVWSEVFLGHFMFGGHAVVFSIVTSIYLGTRYRTLWVLPLIFAGPVISFHGVWAFSASDWLSDELGPAYFTAIPAVAALLFLALIKVLVLRKARWWTIAAWSAAAGVSMTPIYVPQQFPQGIGPWFWLGAHLLLWYLIVALAIRSLANAIPAAERAEDQLASA